MQQNLFCKNARLLFPIMLLALLPCWAHGQTNCEDGNGPLDSAEPKGITISQIIEKLGAGERMVKEARNRYTFTQEVRIQTLAGTEVDGQFHEITSVSYDEKGKRLEKVTFGEQSTLQRIKLTELDTTDIRAFMPLVLPTADLAQYNLRYSGQQHVDDLDTYQFHIEPKKIEKNHRYFQGRIWVDNQDFQIVKVCGKSVPEQLKVKKNQPADVRPTFVTYRRLVEGRYWFPAYTRSDETLQFRAGSVHVREIVKYSDYKLAGAKPEAAATARP
jgi:hypothetical protein